MLAIYLANTKHFSGNRRISGKYTVWMNICRAIQFFDLWLEKSDSHSDGQIFLKTQRLDLQMVANNSTRWNSSKKQHEKLVAILIFSYKISGIPVKSQTVWKIPQKYILADQIHFYCIFMRKKGLAEVLLIYAEKMAL